jgi:hypothetical protein
LDDIESESPATGSQTPADEATREVQEPLPITEEPEQVPTVEEKKPIEESATAEDKRVAPTKKTKKSKKSKRKTLDFASEEPTETSTPDSEPRELEKDESSNHVAPSTAGLVAGALAGLEDAAVLGEDQQKLAEESEWAPTSNRKSKKDKSKKKGMDFSLANDDESTPVTESERDAPELVTAEKQAGTIEEPATVDEVDRHAVFTDKLSEEPDSEVVKDDNAEHEVPIEDNESAVPTKKSKKDKKSKRKQSPAAFDEEQPADDDAQPQSTSESRNVDEDSRAVAVEDFPTAPGAAHIDDVTNHYFGMLKAYQPKPSAPDNKPQLIRSSPPQTLSTTEEITPASENDATPDIQPNDPLDLVDQVEQQSILPTFKHDFPVIHEVSHVDDVVEFHYGLLKDYKPNTASVQESREIIEQAVPATLETAATFDPAEAQADDWEAPVKKSKDKKKKRQSAFEDIEPESTTAIPEAHTDDIVMTDESRDLIPNQDVLQKDQQSAEPQQPQISEPQATNEEDEYPVVTKKSKKDKKMQRQSTFDNFEEPSTEQSKDVSESDAILPVAAGIGAAALGAGALITGRDEPIQEIATIETPAAVEQLFPLSSKKLKKDKKKRQSTFNDSGNEQTASPAPEESRDVTTSDSVSPVDDDNTEMPAERQEAVTAEREEQPFEFSTKKSKKDKKKKRRSTFDDFDTAPTTSTDDLGAAAPVIKPELQRDIDETPAPKEEEAFITPGKKSKDKKKKRQSTFVDEIEERAALSTQDQLQEVLDAGVDIPAETKELETSQRPVLGDDGQPIPQSILEVAPAKEDECAVPPKKSKKDKKKKKTILLWAEGEDSTSQPTETSTPVEPAEARDIQMQDILPSDEEMAIKREAAPAIVPDSMPIVVEHTHDESGQDMRRERRQSRSVPGGWGEDEEEPIVDDPMVDEPAELLDEPSKPVDEPMRDVEEPKDLTVDPDQQGFVQVREEEDLGYVVKKSKKDKKGKKSRKSDAVSEEPQSREVEEDLAPEAAILTIPDTSQDSLSRDADTENESVVSTKRSQRDKSKGQSTRETFEVEQPEEPAVFPIIDPAHVDDVAGHYHGLLRDYQPAVGAPDNKSALIAHEAVNEPGVSHVDDVTNHYYSMLRNYQPAVGAPDNKSALITREVVNEPSVSHVDDVTNHYYGMLRDYQPAVGASDNKPASSTRDVEVPRAEREPSPVSDEETRRARRARRKASPVYSGEEPEDLPGNRSLTPPADHDDMMTTALGVAAGLGLTGAAASAASARSYDEARNLEPEQQPVPMGQAPGWSFAKLNTLRAVNQAQRDSGVQFADSPTLPQEQFGSPNRDSGYVISPANRESWPGELAHDIDMSDVLGRPPRPQSPTSSSEDISGKRSKRVSRDLEEASARREPSPVQSTSKDRSSKLFNSSPSNRIDQHEEALRLDTSHLVHSQTDIHRSPSIHGHHKSREQLKALSLSRSHPIETLETHHESTPSEPHRSIFGPYTTEEGHDRSFSPPKSPLHTISEHSQDTSPSLRRQRKVSDVGSPDRARRSIQHQELGHDLRQAAGIAGAAVVGAVGANELSRPASRAKSLGKSKDNPKSSRSLRRATFDPDVVPSSSTHDPSTGKGKEAAREMSDVYVSSSRLTLLVTSYDLSSSQPLTLCFQDGQGEYPGSSMSPTRPPSMRKRQSMQQIKDLETRLDQLAAENQTLTEAKITAERHLEDIQLEQHKSRHAEQEAVEAVNVQLREKDEAIARLEQELEGIRQDHARLSEINAGLSDAHENLRSEHEQQYSQLEEQHAQTHQNWQESSRELETLRGRHAELSGGMEDIVRHEIDTALAEKNAEIERLHRNLEIAKEKINELQQQILSGGGDDILNFRDEDYFENACQSLCQHVQQWVLRFSKFSDTLVCRTTNQIRDEKLVDRFDLAILDGSDVDAYLTDRIKRRDVFMSVVMTMIFEYIFTRYLFGMDRDQRQTLKKLEKALAEVGPTSAVHQWRAMTLTLLARREAFNASRQNDTEAVVLQIYDTLSRFLPPPQNLQAQVQESLRNVMRTAVDLSIEMRTQKAEYIMLPPLQPEYDTNGDLTRKVYFNASLMNERSGETSSNDELEAQQAVVRMVLFPLVVKKGNDDGEGEEEIVVCPAQVLVARPDRKSKANSGRVVSGQSDRMSVDQMSRANASRHSLAPSTMDMTNVI